MVRFARDGDEGAASVLLERLYPLVLKIVRSHLPKRSSEEDLCQMIFVRIFHRLDQDAGTAPLEHWVSRIAMNVCLNQLESERIRPELRHADLNDEQISIVEALASTAVELPEEQTTAASELVTQLLLRLEPKDRLIITMLHLEERSIAEIKAATGWNTALIKVRAYRARQKLKRIYARLSKPIQ
jgi:RNA polymerase sigma-70 factor (ECF subfamily)